MTCQNERSQHKNRDTAMKLLRARLYKLELEKRKEEQAKIEGEKKEIGFGSQIRSYVLQPYQLVKDLRTQHEIGDPARVLDGDLDGFIEAYLVGAGAEDARTEASMTRSPSSRRCLPTRSGVAHYASMLLPALAKRAEVRAFDSLDGYRRADFDAVIYQLGNNPHHEVDVCRGDARAGRGRAARSRAASSHRGDDARARRRRRIRRGAARRIMARPVRRGRAGGRRDCTREMGELPDARVDRRRAPLEGGDRAQPVRARAAAVVRRRRRRFTSCRIRTFRRRARSIATRCARVSASLPTRA